MANQPTPGHVLPSELKVSYAGLMLRETNGSTAGSPESPSPFSGQYQDFRGMCWWNILIRDNIRCTYGCFQKYGWFIMETPIKFMIWGYPCFWKHPYLVKSIQIVPYTRTVPLNLVFFYNCNCTKT